MSTFSAKVGVHNDNKVRPHVVWVEPWAEDFTLLPKEELELQVTSLHSTPWFNIVESDGHTQIYVEGVDLIEPDYRVIQKGTPLRCGHNRQAAVDAGIDM